MSMGYGDNMRLSWFRGEVKKSEVECESHMLKVAVKILRALALPQEMQACDAKYLILVECLIALLDEKTLS